MGVNHGSVVSLRIKRQAKIIAKSLDLKRYNNFFLLRKRDCLEPRSYQPGNDGYGGCKGRPPYHHTARDCRSGRDIALK
jgi:hypothetical protein